jgi:hypothetical protein
MGAKASDEGQNEATLGGVGNVPFPIGVRRSGRAVNVAKIADVVGVEALWLVPVIPDNGLQATRHVRQTISPNKRIVLMR